jgi:acyl CoA:acetate/3-ketoacid CoA transferase alpha subunit
VTTVAQCVNGGGKHPSATNKSFSGDLASTATNQADQSGKITTELTIYALPALFCPAGQSTVITTATFSNVTLTDTTNGVTASIPGTFVYVAP